MKSLQELHTALSDPEINGRIFDIRRFSTHDGEGIRTTVFFKGCPLRCVWCQNPEGLSVKPRPVWFENQCIHCGICVSASMKGGCRLEENTIRLNPEAPEDWNRLIDLCPSTALRMDSRDISLHCLIEELEKDSVFYRYGGGVTLSGGEPLMQSDFALALLRELKRRDIHTAVESALNVPSGIVMEAVRWTDTFYADLKLFDPEDHKRYTGKDNKLILQNIEALLRSEFRDRVIIRTPLIPGITALHENIAAISGFISGIDPDIRYELLNYNPLAKAKYHLTDREFCFKINPAQFSDDEMKAFQHTAITQGIKNLISEFQEEKNETVNR